MTPETGTKRDKSVTESVTKKLAERIEAWISETTGYFSYEECDKELDIRDKTEKDNRRQVMKRLKDAGVIEPHARNNKLFRYVKVSIYKKFLLIADKAMPTFALAISKGLDTIFRQRYNLYINMEAIEMKPKFYSLREAADKLGVSRAFVYYLKDTKKLKAEKIGHQYVVSEKAIEEYQNNHNK